MRNVKPFAALVFFSFTTLAQIGPPYDLSHNVIASGGGKSTGGNYTVEGTIGQPIAGTQSNGGSFRLRGGFWAEAPLAPTAAHVVIGGRIRTADGRGIRSVAVVLTNASTNTQVSAKSSSFGYYRFETVSAGQTYVLSVFSKRFSFAESVRVIDLADELTNVDFTARP